MKIEIPKNSLKPLLINGDSFEIIDYFEDNSIDSIVSDLPYLISFMGLAWDSIDDKTTENYQEFFKQCYKKLKCGSYMVLFTGTINYDLFCYYARCAGFENVGMNAWIYKSGMPHGKNIVKTLIKLEHSKFCKPYKVKEFLADKSNYKIVLEKDNELITIENPIPDNLKKYVSKNTNVTQTSNNYLLSKLRYLHAEYFGWSVMNYTIIDSDEYESGKKYIALLRNRSRDERYVEGEFTEIMQRYDGFNTQLKPAIEPIAVLRKPIERSIIKNIMKFGTGCINIDDCRIPLEGMEDSNVSKTINEAKRLFLNSNDLSKAKNILSNDKTKEDLKNIIGVNIEPKDGEMVYGNTTIRDRMNSGGGDMSEKYSSSLNEILSSNNVNKEKLMNDMKNMIVGYDSENSKQLTMKKTFNHSIHPAGNSSSNDFDELFKLLDNNKLMEQMKDIFRTNGSKSSTSGIYNSNRYGDLTEKELKENGIFTTTTTNVINNVEKLKNDLKSMTTRHDPTKHKGALFGNALMPMDNKKYTILSLLDKMAGRYPSNVMISENGLLGEENDKIFLVPKPTFNEKIKGVPDKLLDEMHKTIKPLNLMSQLVKLYTPRNGLCVDFFMGSGTTIMACKSNNIRSIGVEIMKFSFMIAKHRIDSIRQTTL